MKRILPLNQLEKKTSIHPHPHTESNRSSFTIVTKHLRHKTIPNEEFHKIKMNFKLWNWKLCSFGLVDRNAEMNKSILKLWLMCFNKVFGPTTMLTLFYSHVLFWCFPSIIALLAFILYSWNFRFHEFYFFDFLLVFVLRFPRYFVGFLRSLLYEFYSLLY